MSTIILLLLIAGAVGFAYAVWSHYNQGPADGTVLKRVWTAVIAAASAIGLAIGQWLHSVTPGP